MFLLAQHQINVTLNINREMLHVLLDNKKVY